LGDSAGRGLGEELEEFELVSVWAGEEGAPPAPRELRVPLGLGGFDGPGTIFSGLGLGGLSAFRDSPPIETLCVEDLGLMSRGTLHGDS
jgi:hypothetical protein